MVQSSTIAAVAALGAGGAALYASQAGGGSKQDSGGGASPISEIAGIIPQSLQAATGNASQGQGIASNSLDLAQEAIKTGSGGNGGNGSALDLSNFTGSVEDTVSDATDVNTEDVKDKVDETLEGGISKLPDESDVDDAVDDFTPDVDVPDNPVTETTENFADKSKEAFKDVGEGFANMPIGAAEGAFEAGADLVPEQVDENTLTENVNDAAKTVMPDEVVEQNLQSNVSDAKTAFNKATEPVDDAIENGQEAVNNAVNQAEDVVNDLNPFNNDNKFSGVI